MPSFNQNLDTLKTATDYPSISHALKELLDTCPTTQLDGFKIQIATLLREKQAAEGKRVGNHPKALQEVDLKYKNLVNILSSHEVSTPVVSQSSPLSKSGGLGGLGAMVLKNFFQSKKKMLLGLGLGLGAVSGLAYIYSKFKGSSEPKKNPDVAKSSKFEGFEKTLGALQRLRSLNKIGKGGNLDDYEGYLSGKKKKNEVKEVKKLIDWNKEENSLVNNADKAIKALANFKLSSPELPLLSDSGSLADFSFEEKKKRKRREKKEEIVVETEDVPVEEVSEEAEAFSEPEPVEEEVGRLIPVVKRNKRVKKVF